MNVEEVNNPGYEQPRKSGRSWMACFGIGCVVLILLCGVGMAITYFTVGQTAVELMQIQQENLALATDSDKVKEKLGSPVTQVVEFVMPEVSQDGDAQIQKSKIKLQGPEGEGYLVSVVRIIGTSVEQTELYLEVGEETINLMGSDDSLELNIEDGEMEDDAEVDEEEPVGAGS